MIEPKRNMLLVELTEIKPETGKIFIPTKDDLARGRVLALGEGVYLSNGMRIDWSATVNDLVLFPTGTGFEVDVPKRGKCVLIRNEDILAVDYPDYAEEKLQ